MSTLHEAARRVVAAWTSTRRTWVEECNYAVLALDAALDAALKAEPAQESFPIRDLLTQAAAMAVASERAGKYEGAAWVADAVLEAAPQPQRPPLTDEEISDIYIDWDITPGRRIADLVRAIERKVRGE